MKGLTDLTAPLRELTHKDSEFTWNEWHTKAVRATREAQYRPSAALLRHVQRSNDSGRCVADGPGSCAHARWPADKLRKQCQDIHRTELCSDREGTVSGSVRM